MSHVELRDAVEIHDAPFLKIVANGGATDFKRRFWLTLTFCVWDNDLNHTLVSKSMYVGIDKIKQVDLYEASSNVTQ